MKTKYYKKKIRAKTKLVIRALGICLLQDESHYPAGQD